MGPVACRPVSRPIHLIGRLGIRICTSPPLQIEPAARQSHRSPLLRLSTLRTFATTVSTWQQSPRLSWEPPCALLSPHRDRYNLKRSVFRVSASAVKPSSLHCIQTVYFLQVAVVVPHVSSVVCDLPAIHADHSTI
jgi:hypothetical protein